MSNTVDVSISRDAASPAIRRTLAAVSLARVQRAVGTACTLLQQNHLRSLPNNVNGWPSQGFWEGCARGTSWMPTSEGITIRGDNENAPGALRYQYQGGTIRMKDKWLTIPARAEFYGHSAGEFTNLRLAIFKSGTMALIIGTGGSSLVNFGTGKESNKGIGPRSAFMIAYWLKDSVSKDANPDVLPSPDEYIETGKQSIIAMIQRGLN